MSVSISALAEVRLAVSGFRPHGEVLDRDIIARIVIRAEDLDRATFRTIRLSTLPVGYGNV